MPLNPKVEISQSGLHGNCWIAGADFKAGEWVWKQREEGAPHTDVFLTYAQVNALPDAKRRAWLALAYQVDDDLMCGFDPEREPLYEELVEDYVNHSCAGNAWYEGADLLVAMRDIAKGEEIAYDYALTENHPDFLLAPCLCRAPECRGRVTGADWKQPRLQEKYGRHFMPHVLRGVYKMKEQESGAQGAEGKKFSQPAATVATTATTTAAAETQGGSESSIVASSNAAAT